MVDEHFLLLQGLLHFRTTAAVVCLHFVCVHLTGNCSFCLFCILCFNKVMCVLITRNIITLIIVCFVSVECADGESPIFSSIQFSSSRSTYRDFPARRYYRCCNSNDVHHLSFSSIEGKRDPVSILARWRRSMMGVPMCVSSSLLSLFLLLLLTLTV